ncbi:MAG: MFS transporter [Ilumatobacteraceae bacterium]
MYETAIETTAPVTPNRWWSLAALTLPVLIISMDATILGFAIPELSTALSPSSSQMLWIIDVYSFVLAGLLVTMGIVGDRIGRRRLLLLGAAGFSVASVLAAFAPNAEALIAARALLGVAGATLMPSTLALIRNVFTDDGERQLAIAIWAVAFSVGAAIGPIVGGFLLDHAWWGSVFLVGVPVTLLLLVVGPRLLPESRDPDPQPFDIPSAGLSMVAMFAVVYAMKSFAEHGSSTTAWIVLALGLYAGARFVRRQRRLDDPMIDVDLFRIPRFSMAISGNMVACFGFSGAMYFVAQHLQLVTGMSAMRAGINLLPSVAATIAITLLAGRRSPHRDVPGDLARTRRRWRRVRDARHRRDGIVHAARRRLAPRPQRRAERGDGGLGRRRHGGVAAGPRRRGCLGVGNGQRTRDRTRHGDPGQHRGDRLPWEHRRRHCTAARRDRVRTRDARRCARRRRRPGWHCGPTARRTRERRLVDGTRVASTVAAVVFVPLAVWAWALGSRRRTGA